MEPEKLKKRLEKRYSWNIEFPLKGYNEIMLIKDWLKPGELGKTIEHLLGYYYIQELSSMLPILALKPKENEFFLDLCSAPGSKTSQAAALMKNKGTIIANDNNLSRIKVLNANLERCGVTNTIITRKDGVLLCRTFNEKIKMKFDKILVDAPCSGEGTLRKSPKTYLMWNLKVIKKLSKIQKKLASSALKVLKVGGEMIYSTCTLAPEENEEVIDFLIKNFDIKIEKINLPIKLRKGVINWLDKEYDKTIENACRLYPQDNDTDGFFLCKIKKLSDKCLLEK